MSVKKCNSSSHAIRNLALRAPKPAIASGLLINRRSAHKSCNIQIHASMICLSHDLWLNCDKKIFTNGCDMIELGVKMLKERRKGNVL